MRQGGPRPLLSLADLVLLILLVDVAVASPRRCRRRPPVRQRTAPSGCGALGREARGLEAEARGQGGELPLLPVDDLAHDFEHLVCPSQGTSSSGRVFVLPPQLGLKGQRSLGPRRRRRRRCRREAPLHGRQAALERRRVRAEALHLGRQSFQPIPETLNLAALGLDHRGRVQGHGAVCLPALRAAHTLEAAAVLQGALLQSRRPRCGRLVWHHHHERRAAATEATLALAAALAARRAPPFRQGEVDGPLHLHQALLCRQEAVPQQCRERRMVPHLLLELLKPPRHHLATRRCPPHVAFASEAVAVRRQQREGRRDGALGDAALQLPQWLQNTLVEEALQVVAAVVDHPELLK
mmetsp:Transcript_82413/g.266925  ORF Transcript_82413/g.266925 Transcript_82413/m.266925 type:complete len:353 (-) Transcript_82413:963-2021(-)